MTGKASASSSLEEIDTVGALRALVILQAADRSERQPEARVPTEVLLHKAGFSNAQIGGIIGEKAGTVGKRIERAEKAESKAAARGAKS